MNGCCEADPNSPGRDEGAATRPPRRSFVGFAGWVVPGMILALMPKCPACLAAYLAVGTGIALSATVAASVRWVLMAMSITWLSYLAVRWIRSALIDDDYPDGKRMTA